MGDSYGIVKSESIPEVEESLERENSQVSRILSLTTGPPSTFVPAIDLSAALTQQLLPVETPKLHEASRAGSSEFPSPLDHSKPGSPEKMATPPATPPGDKSRATLSRASVQAPSFLRSSVLQPGVAVFGFDDSAGKLATGTFIQRLLQNPDKQLDGFRPSSPSGHDEQHARGYDDGPLALPEPGPRSSTAPVRVGGGGRGSWNPVSPRRSSVAPGRSHASYRPHPANSSQFAAAFLEDCKPP